MSDLTPSQRIGLLRIAAALALLLIIALGVLAWQYHAVGLAPTPAGIEAEIKSWGNWAVAASIGLMIAHSLVPFPAEFVTFANGMLFGPLWGVVITWTGAMLGASLAFALARWFGRPFVDALMNERHRAAMDRWMRRQGVGVLLLSRLMPLISFNVINYAAGLTPDLLVDLPVDHRARHPADHHAAGRHRRPGLERQRPCLDLSRRGRGCRRLALVVLRPAAARGGISVSRPRSPSPCSPPSPLSAPSRRRAPWPRC